MQAITEFESAVRIHQGIQNALEFNQSERKRIVKALENSQKVCDEKDELVNDLDEQIRNARRDPGFKILVAAKKSATDAQAIAYRAHYELAVKLQHAENAISVAEDYLGEANEKVILARIALKELLQAK
jgi:ribosome-binding protein aMBF1 (putative translation factor)